MFRLPTFNFKAGKMELIVSHKQSQQREILFFNYLTLKEKKKKKKQNENTTKCIAFCWKFDNAVKVNCNPQSLQCPSLARNH